MTDVPHPPAEDSSAEFVRDLAEAERSLNQLKQRYQQVKTAQQQQAQIEEKQQQIQQEWEKTQLPELQQQLQRLQNQLGELRLILESELLSNEDLMRLYREEVRQGLLGEVFWQIVRFGGIGVVIGWLLKMWAG